MTIDQDLAEILDETVNALSSLDSVKLGVLEQRIVALSKSNPRYDRDTIGLVLPRKCQLEIILQNFQANLDALSRLHSRNMRIRWAQ
jgi:hypothetical protein